MAKKKHKAGEPIDAAGFKLVWVIAKSGECCIGTQGSSFGAFRTAGGAAWFLRNMADAIERDAQSERGNP